MARTTVIAVLLSLVLAPEDVPAQVCLVHRGSPLAFAPYPAGALSTAGIPGGQASALLTALPNAPYLWAVDAAPGSFSFPGFGSVCLGLTPALAIVLDSNAGGPPIPPGGLFIPG